MTGHEEPTTEAGRRLLHQFEFSDLRLFEIRAAVLAIESEARATAPAGLREAVERHLRHLGRNTDFDMDHEELRAALAADSEPVDGD